MSGLQEILLIALLVVIVLLLPRTLSPRRERPVRRVPGLPVSGRLRLALVASVLWPAMAAAYLRPWATGWSLFLYFGVGPVALAWAAAWVRAGFTRGGRRR